MYAMVLNFIHCLWQRSHLRLGRCIIHHQFGTPSPENVRAFSIEKPPTMPSADFCMTITHSCPFVSCSFNIMQISRGKTHSFPDVDARFIKYSPIADGRLPGGRRVSRARSPQLYHTSDLVLVHHPVILDWACFRPAYRRPCLATTPLPFS